MNQVSQMTTEGSSPLGLDEDLVRAARGLYRIQKQDLGDIAATLSAGPVPAGEAEKLARLVHNIAGTASYFGESALGREASALELRLLAAECDDERRSRCLELIQVLEKNRAR